MRFRFFAAIILVLVCFFNATAQQPACIGNKKLLYKGVDFFVCGYEYDKSRNDKLIGEFTLYYKDSLLIDQFHNEDDSFLFQKTSKGITVTQITLEIKGKRFIYPAKFEQVYITVFNGKPLLKNRNVTSVTIVNYLKNNFKKIRQLY